jgi:hypothetical protein
VADRPGVLAQIAQVLGGNEISANSVVQHGIGDDARLVMVVHECLELRFAAAVEEIAELDDLCSAPRSIRVIERSLCEAERRGDLAYLDQLDRPGEWQEALLKPIPVAARER